MYTSACIAVLPHLSKLGGVGTVHAGNGSPLTILSAVMSACCAPQIEADSQKTTFAAYKTRFPAPGTYTQPLANGKVHTS